MMITLNQLTGIICFCYVQWMNVTRKLKTSRRIMRFYVSKMLKSTRVRSNPQKDLLWNP